MKKVVVIGATGNTGAYLVDDFCSSLNRGEYEVSPPAAGQPISSRGMESIT